MATEVAHEPTAARKPLTLNEGVDAISGILSQEPAEEVQEEAVEPEVQAKEEPEPEIEEPEEAAQEVEAKEEPVKEDKAEKSEDVTSEVELEPAQVAQILGLEDDAIDVDDDGGIQINTKVDGKPAKVSLKDLRHSYELAATHEERLRQLGRERKAFQDESKAALEQLTNQTQQLNQSIQTLEEEWASDFQSVDWNTLRLEDPTEYNAKRLDYEDRKQRINQYKAQSQQQSQALFQEHQKKLREQQSEGAERLTEVFQGEAYRNAPKWGDEEGQKLAKWIIDQGFSPEDIGQVGVWQVFKWARDSMLREQELKQARETVKKVTKTTKVIKPGKTKPPSEISATKTKELKARQRKSGGGLKETTDLIRSVLDRGK